MTSAKSALEVALARDWRNALTLGGVVLVLAISHVLAPQWRSTLGTQTVDLIQYGAYLVLFCIWMVWFVETGVTIVQESER